MCPWCLRQLQKLTVTAWSFVKKVRIATELLMFARTVNVYRKTLDRLSRQPGPQKNWSTPSLRPFMHVWLACVQSILSFCSSLGRCWVFFLLTYVTKQEIYHYFIRTNLKYNLERIVMILWNCECHCQWFTDCWTEVMQWRVNRRSECWIQIVLTDELCLFSVQKVIYRYFIKYCSKANVALFEYFFA
jgi:hypothetical protein